MTRLLAALAGWKGYALTAAACLAVGFAGGWTVRDWKAQAELAADRIHAAQAREAAIADALDRERAQTAVTHDVETRVVERQGAIRTVTQTIIKEVPVYVPAEADERFALPDGLVRLHDAAVSGQSVSGSISDAAGEPDGAAWWLEPSRTAPSRLAAVIVENYGVCHAAFAQVEGWQDWARQQLALNPD